MYFLIAGGIGTSERVNAIGPIDNRLGTTEIAVPVFELRHASVAVGCSVRCSRWDRRTTVNYGVGEFPLELLWSGFQPCRLNMHELQEWTKSRVTAMTAGKREPQGSWGTPMPTVTEQ